MFISCFDMFKIGIGPSSSHTLGPMKAGKAFVDTLEEGDLLDRVTRVRADVYGSLSLTGIGHATDKAIIMGLAGFEPETVDIDAMPGFLEIVASLQRLALAGGKKTVDFSRTEGIVFHNTCLQLHENGMTITAFEGDEVLLTKAYFSIGGGFIVDKEHFGLPVEDTAVVPFPYNTAEEVLAHCDREGMSIPEFAWRNEVAANGEEAVREHLAKVWKVMQSGIERGSSAEGILPGDLRVPRRAKALRERLEATSENEPLRMMSWLNMFAMAVNEENASGGRVVTSPTNGACGVLPAVLSYWDRLVKPVGEQDVIDYLLTCGVVGALYKKNASISGAEVGCQGEVGVACSMAAAGIAQLMGATPAQAFAAAEIAMEHNLGLTCDPVCGQVQVPCIERNAIAAVTSVNAANMSLQRGSTPTVSLDQVIQTMYQTGKDMDSKYRETSLGGLAKVLMPRLMPCS
ncbi:L-serine ammonia-lyase [Corynebacterium diphtheriae]|nr:L-serine ammonia-lyase [Corynebacterium diphtheriae]CAB0964362.1 L-serine ammonia-lyase [Corynebacterium diphtheriae]